MPAMLAASHSSSVLRPVASAVCHDCGGSLVAVDDGSFTGHAGELVPCGCAILVGAGCACHVEGWPFNGGFTGWIELTSAEFHAAPEDAPLYRPCTEHNARPLTQAAVAA